MGTSLRLRPFLELPPGEPEQPTRGLGVIEARLSYTQKAVEHNHQPVPFLSGIGSKAECRCAMPETPERYRDAAPIMMRTTKGTKSTKIKEGLCGLGALCGSDTSFLRGVPATVF